MTQPSGIDLNQPTPDTGEFRDYLKAEYDHIAEAHFRTIETITSFFRYYLLIMAAPITVFGIVLGSSDAPQTLFAVVEGFQPLLALVLCTVSMVGCFVMLYIINLRMDAILYAKTVNAIRKYFYDRAPMELDAKLRTRTLPQTPTRPAYDERWYFFPVVSAFALFNTLYLVLGLVLWWWPFDQVGHVGGWSEIMPWETMGGLALLPLHYVGYWLVARYREYAYLRSFGMGVDIDGVLNKHREHFCELLRQKTNKTLAPEQICTIPLRECPRLDVSRAYETEVFNDPRYWTDMPVLEDSARIIRGLRKAFKLKIHVFSHRPWPEIAEIDADGRADLLKLWHDAALGILDTRYGSRSLRKLLGRFRLQMTVADDEAEATPRFRLDRRFCYWARRVFGLRPIDLITAEWLRAAGFQADTLMIERASDTIADPQAHTRNRFHSARKRQLRFFVEDDWQKASKLAYTCDVVFLLEYPYNALVSSECAQCNHDCRQPERAVPRNVVRVRSWEEIRRHVRRLS